MTISNLWNLYWVAVGINHWLLWIMPLKSILSSGLVKLSLMVYWSPMHSLILSSGLSSFGLPPTYSYTDLWLITQRGLKCWNAQTGNAMMRWAHIKLEMAMISRVARLPADYRNNRWCSCDTYTLWYQQPSFYDGLCCFLFKLYSGIIASNKTRLGSSIDPFCLPFKPNMTLFSGWSLYISTYQFGPHLWHVAEWKLWG